MINIAAMINTAAMTDNESNPQEPSMAAGMAIDFVLGLVVPVATGLLARLWPNTVTMVVTMIVVFVAPFAFCVRRPLKLMNTRKDAGVIALVVFSIFLGVVCLSVGLALNLAVAGSLSGGLALPY